MQKWHKIVLFLEFKNLFMRLIIIIVINLKLNLFFLSFGIRETEKIIK